MIDFLDFSHFQFVLGECSPRCTYVVYCRDASESSVICPCWSSVVIKPFFFVRLELFIQVQTAVTVRREYEQWSFGKLPQ